MTPWSTVSRTINNNLMFNSPRSHELHMGGIKFLNPIQVFIFVSFHLYWSSTRSSKLVLHCTVTINSTWLGFGIKKKMKRKKKKKTKLFISLSFKSGKHFSYKNFSCLGRSILEIQLFVSEQKPNGFPTKSKSVQIQQVLGARQWVRYSTPVTGFY